MFQGGAQILPGLLAVAEARKLSGRDLLCAFILGYDAGARLSLSMTPRALVHQNGQATLLGASAAGARLRGLDAAGTSLALRLGATLMLTPSYTDAIAGATALNVAGGMCGHAVSLAPELALAGFEAQADAIELWSHISIQPTKRPLQRRHVLLQSLNNLRVACKLLFVHI
jgi:2-methylcitrate dehydratase PrpD